MGVYSSYLNSNQAYIEKWDQGIEEVQLDTPTPCSINGIVQIPTLAQEGGMIDTLSLIEGSDFNPDHHEVIVLINNSVAEDIAHMVEGIINFARRSPGFPLKCYVASDPKLFDNLSQARAALDVLSVRTLRDDSDETLNDTFFFHTRFRCKRSCA
ncbi:MAG: hypothetical protein US89_C0012G0022 [Candidatus Peregrinibacteria bacterium GW2011_GWF2_38_29]|nr:MAG: hypothetical protein US89_C0012G0022 [Candidatus Peregrinibacteria bacterium GW2011_GWF2_38_29]HBB02474.1 hypothetical protein [Candidatus Peregrinibacteria bacterium]